MEEIIEKDEEYIKKAIDLIVKNNLLNENGLIICETDFPLEIKRNIYTCIYKLIYQTTWMNLKNNA